MNRSFGMRFIGLVLYLKMWYMIRQESLILTATARTESLEALIPFILLTGSLKTDSVLYPTNIFMLTADATGVLPPLSKLDNNQAMYYFMSGYTSKLAGTERGITEPQPNFSACFGSPFLPLRPFGLCGITRQKIHEHHANVWLLNTGWSNGRYGIGKRFSSHLIPEHL